MNLDETRRLRFCEAIVRVVNINQDNPDKPSFTLSDRLSNLVWQELGSVPIDRMDAFHGIIRTQSSITIRYTLKR